MKRIYLAAIAASHWVASALLLDLPAVAGPISRPGLALLPAAAQSATEYTLGSLRIKAPWMRATPKGAKVAGGFLTVTNTGDKPDRLIGVESDIATSVDIHEMSMSGGVMSMRPVDKPLEIAPGASLELKPGGYHVMFGGLRQGVKEGDKVKATLVFESAGRLEIEFVAGGITASGPGMAMPKM
jgi:copper(I)-binding protein